MIDTLLRYREKAKRSNILGQLGLVKNKSIDKIDRRDEIRQINQTNQRNEPSETNRTRDYAILTLHRPSNVDDKGSFTNILEGLRNVSRKVPIIFPAHPRTQKQIKLFGYERYFTFIDHNSKNCINPKKSINLLNPLPYLDFLNLMANARLVLTDSGGIQEETTILGIPCLTLRENTERPITVTQGSNTIVGSNPERIVSESMKILNGGGKVGKAPELWDGKAAEKIVGILLEKLWNRYSQPK